MAELCRRYGIDQSQFYRWREAFLAGGTKALEMRRLDHGDAPSNKGSRNTNG